MTDDVLPPLASPDFGAGPETLPEPIVHWQPDRRRNTGAAAIGAAALGAFALGAIAIGAVAIGSLAVGRMRVRRLIIDELVVKRRRGI